MKTNALLLALSLTACVDAGTDTTELDQENRTTSASVLPNKIVLAHLDDAAGANLVQYDQNRLFVTRTDYAGTPVMHHYFRANISQLIVGDFALPNTRESGHDQICALLADNSMECLSPSDDRSQLVPWFSQGNVVGYDLPIVGDFTGDGADDILAYSPLYGSLRLLSRTATGTFATAPFALGNLSSIDLKGKQLYAGEFGQASNRADLLVVDRLANNVRRYDSVTDAGKTTFWWSFTSANNMLVANEQIVVANIDGGTRDGLILRDPATGGTRLVRAEYNLPGYPTVALGQIPITTHAAQIAAVKLADHSSEPGGAVRDDVLFFDRTAGTVASIGARHDGTRMTYWWGYTKATPVQTGWVPRQDTPVAIILCKLSDVDYTPDTIGLRRKLVERGTNSVRDYLFQISYGTIDIAHAYVTPWVTTTKTAAGSSARIGQKYGLLTWEYIAGCKEAAGVDGNQYNGRVLVVLNDVDVAFQGINGYGAAVDYKAVLDGKLSGVTHELLHAFGLNHAHDDSGTGTEYGDTSDLMGDFYPTDIAIPGGTWGPELNASHRDDLGVIPNNRIIDLDPVSSPTSQTITLAPLESPEAQGTLMVTLKSGNFHYTVALRRTVGLDANTGVNGIQVHLVDPVNQLGATTLRTLPKRTLVAGDTVAVGAFMLEVESLDSLARKAVITVTHY